MWDELPRAGSAQPGLRRIVTHHTRAGHRGLIRDLREEEFSAFKAGESRFPAMRGSTAASLINS